MLTKAIDDKIEGSNYIRFRSIYMNSFVNAYMYLPNQSAEAFYPNFQQYCKKEQLFFYHNEEGNIVGQFRLIKKTGYQSHVVEIGAVAIDPNYQGSGFGKQMLEAAIDYIKNNRSKGQDFENIDRIELSYEADNPIAARGIGELYIKCGFVIEGHFDDWFQRDETQNYLRGKYPNPTREIFASLMLTENVNTKSEQKDISSLTIKNNHYNFRAASANDIKAIVKMHENNDFFSDLTSAGTIFLVTDPEENYQAACIVEQQEGRLNQCAVISNIIFNDNYEAMTYLFKGLVSFYLDMKPVSDVRRLEINIPSFDTVTGNALVDSKFEHTGTQIRRFKNQDVYSDELMYQYSLYGLKDAYLYLQRRSDSNKILHNFISEITNEKQRKKLSQHFVPLTGFDLTILQGKLAELEHLSLEFCQEQMIYKIIRTICSHDYLSVSERLSYCKELSEEYPELHNLTDFAIEILSRTILSNTIENDSDEYVRNVYK